MSNFESMDVALLKYTIIERLINTNDQTLLKKVAELIKPNPVTYAENILKPMTVEELEERILRSRKDSHEGRTRSSEEMKDYFRKK